MALAFRVFGVAPPASAADRLLEHQEPGPAAAKHHVRHDLDLGGQHVPTTFDEMFRFNAAVMGMGSHAAWMGEVLLSFDAIVSNASNPLRLQEECDVLSLRLIAHEQPIHLGDFKSVMLASLRSLVPKEWDTEHEVAWSWLWSNVEGSVGASLGRPAGQMEALESFVTGLDGDALSKLNRAAFLRFFEIAPAAQDFFRQSNTRLAFIAGRILALTLEMYQDPSATVEQLSGLGLRHVGYDSPSELFAPFVTAYIEVVRANSKNPLVHDAFSWSLSLVSRIMLRAISEGSTIVMKAINANSNKLLQKAVACAPRGDRASWVLNIQVGLHRISPLEWAVQSGRLEAARAILVDLLTIRADRERYYCGLDDLFARHPDVIRRLCLEAPSLLPTLLDGLVWRSRNTHRGQRRVNYYVRHLLVGPDGEFAEALGWLTEFGDPGIACHPVVRLVSDLVWDGAASKPFLWKNCWHLFSLAVFVTSQSIVENVNRGRHTENQRSVMFAVRCFIYIRSMVGLACYHGQKVFLSIRGKTCRRAGGIPVPAYLCDWQEVAGVVLLLVLVLMFASEPILYCMGDPAATGRLFAQYCPYSANVHLRYSLLTMTAVLIHWVRLLDIALFSTRLAAHVLVCGQVLPEFVLFIAAITCLVAMFCTSTTALDHDSSNFSSVGDGAVSLMEIVLGVSGSDMFAELQAGNDALAVVVGCFAVAATLFFGNLLIAQMSTSYSLVYKDMVGRARLRRAKIIVEMVATLSKQRWARFVASLRLDQKLEFNEGDLGPAGGVQVLEPAGAHPTADEAVVRCGGPTGPSMPWPDTEAAQSVEDRVLRLEKLMRRTLAMLSSQSGHGSSLLSSDSSSVSSHSSSRGHGRG